MTRVGKFEKVSFDQFKAGMEGICEDEQVLKEKYDRIQLPVRRSRSLQESGRACSRTGCSVYSPGADSDSNSDYSSTTPSESSTAITIIRTTRDISSLR